MTDREENIYDMFVNTLAFNTENSADYAAIPAGGDEFRDRTGSGGRTKKEDSRSPKGGK